MSWNFLLFDGFGHIRKGQRLEGDALRRLCRLRWVCTSRSRVPPEPWTRKEVREFDRWDLRMSCHRKSPSSRIGPYFVSCKVPRVGFVGKVGSPCGQVFEVQLCVGAHVDAEGRNGLLNFSHVLLDVVGEGFQWGLALLIRILSKPRPRLETVFV